MPRSANGDFEQVLIRSDPHLGLRAVFAIHNTTLGPAMGGVRRWHYPSDPAGVDDAMRLAAGMTFKNALAGLPFGGGKAVILARERRPITPAELHRFGQWVEQLGGTYITAEDVGMCVANLVEVGTVTDYVTGIGANGLGGDPGPMTAAGVFSGLRAACGGSVSGTRVAVQGLGNVGARLCALLHDAGASLTVADIDSTKVDAMVDAYGACASTCETILAAPVDVLAPCALGHVLTAESVQGIEARVIAGSANNQLASPEVGQWLHDRGIRYAPDYLINAGGIISCAFEYLGRSEAEQEVGAIGPRLMDVFERSAEHDLPPEVIARQRAIERLGAGRATKTSCRASAAETA